MNKSRSCYSVPTPSPKIIFTIILSLCFFLQVRNNVSKFLRRQTTKAMSSEVEPGGVSPPVLSFCPGHNKGWREWEDMYSMLENDNVTEEDMVHWLSKKSFDIKSIVTFMSHMSAADKYGKNKDFMTTFNISADLPNSPFSSFYTWIGQCYLLHFEFPLHPPSYIAIYFNLTEVGRLAINAHTIHDEIGLNYGYWPVKPNTVVLDKQDVQVYVEYTKVIEMHRRDEGTKDCLDQDEYDHPKCVAEWAKTRFKSIWKEEDITPCWWTVFHYLVLDQDLPLCRSNDTIQLMSRRAHDVYRALENPRLTGCPKSCRQISYRPDLSVQPSSSYYDIGKTGFFIYMSGSVETVEEYLLFDASEIITAVGGSLGLFLGFSCLSVISYFGGTFARFSICKNTNTTLNI